MASNINVHDDIPHGELEAGMPNLPSGSGVEIRLKKTIISNQKAQEAQDTEFEEVAISEENFDDSKIQNIYDGLFYLIPERGDESHESIIIQSNDLINPHINENLDSAIKALEGQLLDKNEEYLKATVPSLVQEHPLFPNGTFLQEGNVNDNTPLDSESQMWFIQQGFRRPIKGANIDFLRKI